MVWYYENQGTVSENRKLKTDNDKIQCNQLKQALRILIGVKNSLGNNLNNNKS